MNLLREGAMVFAGVTSVTDLLAVPPSGLPHSAIRSVMEDCLGGPFVISTPQCMSPVAIYATASSAGPPSW
jgi:hypothetical protein